jgi:hypothetical protein
MANTLLLQNLPPAIAIALAAYAWYRTGFRTPGLLHLAAPTTRPLVVAFGWILVVAITAKSIGGLFGDGRVALASSGQMYAYRTREPMLFWGEIAGEMPLVGGIGALLIHSGRRPARGISA